MARDIGDPKRKRKPGAATAAPQPPFRRRIREPIRPPATKSRGSRSPRRHTVISAHHGWPGIDPGGRVKFRLLRPRQPCLTFFSVRLAARFALASSRQAEVADASTDYLRVRG